MTMLQRFRRYARVLFAASAMVLATVAAEAEVHFVTQEGDGSKNGANWENAYDEAAFPAAILSAGAGDEIWVKAGVYRPSTANVKTASFALKNGVAVYGGFAGTEASSADRNPVANVTVLTGDLANDDTHDANGVTVNAANISGDNSLCVVSADSGCGLTTVLDGFTITAGKNAANHGGGMFNNNSSPIVANCAFSGNTATNGGGMNNTNSDPTVTNCAFSGNAATNWGGGMCNTNSSPTVTDCAFSGNSAEQTGGGMYNVNGSSPTVTDCAFSRNSADFCGGMHNESNSSPTVTNCTFSGNIAPCDGGGMYNYINSNSLVTNCTFSGNSAGYGGGGMCNHHSNPTVTNCTFSGNSAGTGGGMCNRSNSKSLVTNCIFWDSSGGEVYNNDDDSTPTVSSCVVSGEDVGTGTVSSDIISADPLLGPLADNGGPTQTHALLTGSPAIDAGTGAGAPATDQRGVARPQGSAFDIGAYESWEKKILTVTAIGSGSVTRDPSGDIVGTTGKCWSYDKDTPVALTAVDGSRDWFATWSGDASGITKTASVTMSCDHAVEAVFDPVWIITVSAGPGGDIISSDSGTGSAGRFAPGGRASGTTTVNVRNGADKTFTVSPDAGYSIDKVLVDSDIKILSGSKYTFVDVAADHTLEATFTVPPTPTLTPTPVVTPSATLTPTAAPTDSPAPTTNPSVTPTPVPTPDPDIPLPKVTLTITLYAGGTLVSGPIDITDPATLTALLSSRTLLAQLLATYPDAILSGTYNMDLVRFFSLVANLDPGVLDFTMLLEIQVEGVPSGYRAQLFMLTRTFDANGKPTGYAVVPRNEGESVFRKARGARGWTEAWRVTVRDGSASDGDVRQDGFVAPQIAAVVAVFPMATPTVTVTPTHGSTGSGGCSIPESGGAALAAILLLAPVVLMRQR